MQKLHLKWKEKKNKMKGKDPCKINSHEKQFTLAYIKMYAFIYSKPKIFGDVCTRHGLGPRGIVVSETKSLTPWNLQKL